MSGWAALAAGFGSLGEQMQNKAKTQLEERLDAEREARAEERQKAREQRAEMRERQKVTSKRRYLGEGGVWREQGVNSFGDDVGEARLLNAQEIEDINADRQKAADETKRRALETTLLEKKVADYDTDKSLDRRYRESLIDNKDRQYTGTGRGGGSGKPQFFLPDGSQTTRKEAEKMVADEIADNGDAPRGIADYLGRKKINSDVEGTEFHYSAPGYSKMEGEGKDKADLFSDLALKLAKAVDSGSITRAQAEQALRSRGFPQAAEGFDSWLKIARGR